MKRRILACLVMISGLLVAIPTSSSERASVPRPFWGKLTGEATFPFSDACLEVTGVPWQTLSASEGKMTHLGLTALSTSHCSTPDGSAALHGLATFTAANGDQLWTAFTSETVVWPSPPQMLLVQETNHTIVGGTGRFENASGHLSGMVYVIWEGLQDPSWPLEFVLAGTISH